MGGVSITMRLEAIPVTRHDGLISVRLWTIPYGERPTSCGIIVMGEENWVAVALRPPTSDLISVVADVTEGTVDDLLRAILVPNQTPA